MRWITTPLPFGTAGSPTPIDFAAISVFLNASAVEMSGPSVASRV